MEPLRMTHERKFLLLRLAFAVMAMAALVNAFIGVVSEQPLWSFLATLACLQLAALEVLAGVLKRHAILK